LAPEREKVVQSSPGVVERLEVADVDGLPLEQLVVGVERSPGEVLERSARVVVRDDTERGIEGDEVEGEVSRAASETTKVSKVFTNDLTHRQMTDG
jgi:hypothetical protein